MFLPSKVLVLTYKNQVPGRTGARHGQAEALDDFLSHMIDAGYSSSIARIGRSSDSQELQRCNLRRAGCS